MNPVNLDEARAVLAAHDNRERYTRWELRCSDGHVLGSTEREADAVAWRKDPRRECLRCVWGDADPDGNYVAEVACFRVNGPAMSDKHLRAALAEVDRLTAERDALQARLVTADDLARLADENIAALETRAVRAERELQCERSAPAPVPTPTHAFIGDANADCATCGLPTSHPSHRRTA